jgi:leucyl/phenylalanyl-tRNA--protein transferase
MPFEYIFPDPENADSDGLLAVGGDLSIESLLTAYAKGIFPWYDQHTPILWWSPDPRLVLFPDKFRPSKSLLQKIRSGYYQVDCDTRFEQVITCCAEVKRKVQEGTWITPEMKSAYINMHQQGYAHSFETYYGKAMVGGLYGVSLGRAFFGESMFYQKPDASKVALFYLVRWLKSHGFSFIDAQQSTLHLKSMGAEEIPRKQFMQILAEALKQPTIKGKWRL